MRLLVGRTVPVGVREACRQYSCPWAEPAQPPAANRVVARRATSANASINELAEAGFVERTTDAADRRRNVVTMTPAGSQQLGKLDGVLAGIQDELLAPLAADERDQLTRLLGRILDYRASD